MTDNNSLSHLPLPSPVKFVLSRLERAGYPAYAVGGCVRDHIMGVPPGDYDVTTGAKPEEILKVFSDCRVVETGLKHGTVTIVKDGMNIETTTYRIDGTYDDGRHPDSVTFTDNLSDDLMRRDFTINAMAYSPDRGIVDLYGGREDIEKRTVRCVGCASDRFSEDGLRILRALRFSSTLGFTPDKECSDAITALTPLLSKISRERIYTEVSKLLRGKNAPKILAEYASVISFVIPELTENGVKSAAKYIESLGSIKIKDSLCLRYALLFSSLDTKDAESAINSLKTSRDEKRGILEFFKHKDKLIKTPDRYALKRLIAETSDGFPAYLAAYLTASDKISLSDAEEIIALTDSIIEKDECRSLKMLALGGEDLIKIGLGGQMIGKTLSYLLDSVMRGDIPNEKEIQLSISAEINSKSGI